MGSCAIEAPVKANLSAQIDFKNPGKIDLDVCSIKVGGDKSVVLSDTEGKALGSFKVDGNGKLVPAGSQPGGNLVKSSYSGAPGDSYSAYKIYPPDYKTGSGIKPYLAVDYSKGTLNVTPGSDVKRSRQASKGSTHKGGGATAGDPGCGTGGGGG